MESMDTHVIVYQDTLVSTVKQVSFKAYYWLYYMSQKKQALKNVVPSYKFCFEEGLHILQLLLVKKGIHNEIVL